MTTADLTTLSSDDPLPLYRQLARHLRRMIANGALQVEDALPGERDLARRFDVSRVTVRKALQSLADEGLLQPRARAGTYVSRAIHVEQPLSTLTGFSEDMVRRGLEPSSRWLARGTGPAAPDEAMALGLAPGAKVSRLKRLRLADNVPLAVETSVIPHAYLPNPEQVTGSLYETLRRQGYAPHRAVQRLTAVVLSEGVARLLDTPAGAAALAIERRSFLASGAPLELVRSHYRGDAYDFVVELSLPPHTDATDPQDLS
ncbi:MAG: GntR family transcriptional regulator [Azospirillaceae bacterium]|nr:GntR family transcriptional regulator [Azospirillaceae bacterium]